MAIDRTHARTLVIGDEAAGNLAPLLRGVPNAGPVFSDPWSFSPIEWWAKKGELGKGIARVNKIDGASRCPTCKDWGQQEGDLVLVALGLNEIRSEPSDATQEQLDGVAEDVQGVIDQIKATGAGQAWVLPPRQPAAALRMPAEGKARGIVAKTLAKNGVRFFDAAGKTYPLDAKGNLAADGYVSLAKQLAIWVPVGKSGVGLGPIYPRHPSGTPAIIEQVQDFFGQEPDPHAPAAAGLSRRAKIGIGVALLAIGGSVAYAVNRRR